MELDSFNNQALYTALQAENKMLKAHIAVLEKQQRSLQVENKTLKEQLASVQAVLDAEKAKRGLLQQKLFGKSSEKKRTAGKGNASYSKKNQGPATRQSKAEKYPLKSLPMHIVECDVSEEEKICPDCGKALHAFESEESQQLEQLARKIYLRTVRKHKYVCKSCKGQIVQGSSVSTEPIPKGLLGASFIAHCIIDKYQWHLPFYRQSQRLKAEGLPLSDGQLSRSVMQCGELLAGMCVALIKAIAASSYLQVDETPVKLLEPEKQAYLWCYLSPLAGEKLVMFDFQPNRSAAAFEAHLADFNGVWQTDGYQGYQARRKAWPEKSFGCFAHARRKFVEVVKLTNAKEGIAYQAVGLIEKLYKIERTARSKQLSHEDRQKLREDKALPVLEQLKVLCEETETPARMPLGKAVNYCLNQWDYLTGYVHDGRVEIDNNWVENAIRPVALGRKNWLFVKHEDSGKINALLMSLVQSAKINGLDPRWYMHYLLLKTQEIRRSPDKADALLPHRIDPEVLKALKKKHEAIGRTLIPPDTS